MLSSGAHVSINGEEFLLAETEEGGHYVHEFKDLMPDTTDQPITGSPGNRSLRSDSLMWTIDDWAGGEGNRNYYADEWDVYDHGWELNPRIRGQITGRPNRYQIEPAVTDCRERPAFTTGVGGKLWMSCGIDLLYSSDPTSSFTLLNDTNDTKLATLSANYRIKSLAADDKWCYYSGWHSGTSGSRITRAVDASGNDCIVQAEATSRVPFAGLTVMNGRLYAWTGKNLVEMDVEGLANGGTGLASDKIRTVFNSGAELADGGAGLGSLYWADCFATDNSIIMWVSTPMQSRVYEFKKGVGRPVWTVPYGFTIKSGAFSNGVAMFSGHYDADGGTAGYGALWALPLASYTPIFVKWVRRTGGGTGTAMQLQAVSASYGMQFLVSAIKTGRVFVYDMETDGFSMLDHLDRATGTDPDGGFFVVSTEDVGDTTTYGRYRVVAVYSPGAAAAGTNEIQVYSYDDDETNNIETGLNTTDYTGLEGYWQSPSWHFGYPMERKSLVGFHFTFDKLVSGQQIQLYYSADNGSWTSTTAITSATAGTTEGRYFLNIGALNFTNLRLRVYITSSTGVAAPILKSVSTEARLCRRRESWRLLLRAKDMSQGTRLSSQRLSGNRVRENMIGDGTIPSFVRNATPVTFLDGYRYKQNDTYATHTVIVKDMTDVVQKKGEGIVEVELVKVPASGNEDT